MRTKASALILTALFAAPVEAASSDPLCSKLNSFEAAPLQPGQPRWVEFHWGFDPKAIPWSWGCRHSEDRSSKATCDWLMHHTNQEFSMILPLQMMACHGYRIPKFAYYDWNNVVGTIRLRGATDRRILMDLDYGHLAHGEQAVRLSVEDANSVSGPVTLSPIRSTANAGKIPAS